eukprot:Skav209870  [mRNA]  locus=scaffold590:116276:126622:+ [translate_table: standard]
MKIFVSIFSRQAFDRHVLRSNHKDADVTVEEHCLRRANHPGIKWHKWHKEPRPAEEFHYFTLEFCPAGELWTLVRNVGCEEHLARRKHGFFSRVLRYLSTEIQYLRDAQIVHRDLKPAAQCNCKLIDFGSAKDLANPQVHCCAHLPPSIPPASTYSYRMLPVVRACFLDFTCHRVIAFCLNASQVVKNKGSDHRSDTWSLGCLVFQVLTGLLPFFGGTICRVYRKICAWDLCICCFGVKSHSYRGRPTGPQLDLPSHWLSPDATDLIQRMVVKDLSSILFGIENLLEEHPFFVGMNFAGAHARAAPVRTLEEMCLRHIGRRWKEPHP